MSNISQFQIKKLYGYKDISVNLKNNTLILVGENGTGKTTVLRLLYYLLSGQLDALSKYNFEELKVTINKQVHSLPYPYLKQRFRGFNEEVLRRFSLPPGIRRRFLDVLRHYGRPEAISEIERLCDQFDIPFLHLMHELEISSHEGKRKKITR